MMPTIMRRGFIRMPNEHGGSGGSFGGDNNKKGSEDVPLLHQWDPRWSGIEYPYSSGGGSPISESGCGPTCFCMVARWYGINIFPPDVVNFAAAYHTDGGTNHGFFADAAKNFGFSMVHSDSKQSALSALEKGYPVIAAHGPGMFTYGGHFILYAKLVNNGAGLIVNDPNQGYSKNKNGDDYVFSTEEVLSDGGVSDWFIPTKPHEGLEPLLVDQSSANSGEGGISGGPKSSDQGFRVKVVGKETVRIIKLPENKCFAEPIYPDYIMISDTIPSWVLSKTIEDMNKNNNKSD